MFDDDDGVALFDQGVEDLEEFSDVFEVEAGGGFVEDVDGAAGGTFGEFLGELDALRLAAGEGCRLLAELDVAEPDLGEGLELVVDRRNGGKELDGGFDQSCREYQRSTCLGR